MCEVVNKRVESFDIYIGRGSKWGNPFIIGQHGDRAEVIDLFEDYFRQQIDSGTVSIDDLKALNGKKLGCFCKPAPCHGDVIKRAVDWAMAQ